MVQGLDGVHNEHVGLELVNGVQPGIGKSTLMLQICDNLCRFAKVLYVSGEESERQMASPPAAPQWCSTPCTPGTAPPTWAARCRSRCSKIGFLSS